MTASTKTVRNRFLHGEAVLPRFKGFLAAAAGTLKEGWLAMFNASNYVDQAATGTTKVGWVSGGFLPYDQTAGAADGDAPVILEARPNLILQSTTAGDALVDGDAPAVAYAADNRTIGKLGTNRSLAGLFLGIDEDTGMAILWPGRIAHAIAQALGMAKAPGLLWQKAAADGAAGTATAESVIPRLKRQERIVSIEYVPAAALTANDTNYATITIRKRDGAGGAAVTVASVTTKITGGSGDWTAFQAVSLGTIANADLLVGDLLTIEITKPGTGARQGKALRGRRRTKTTMAANGGNYSYPGLKIIGVTDPNVRELVTQFTTHALGALQMPGEETGISWCNDLYHATPIELGDEIVKLPIDLTQLNGFEEWAGVRKFNDTQLTAVAVSARPFDKSVGLDINKAKRGLFGGFPEKGAQLVQTGRLTLPRLVADLIKNGKTAKTACYDGKPLWATDHLIDPLGDDVTANQQSNYKAAFGKFTVANFKKCRTLMRQMRGLLSEPLGLSVSVVLGPTHMEDPFEEVLDVNKVIVANAAGTAADSNVVRGKAAWRICSQLDTDPYVVANAGKHMWIALSLSMVGVRPFEAVQTNGGVPILKFLGEDSEFAALHNKVGVVADQHVGVAPAFYMTAIRFEET